MKRIPLAILPLLLLVAVLLTSCDQTNPNADTTITADPVTEPGEAPSETGSDETPTEVSTEPVSETYSFTVTVEGKGTVTFNGEAVNGSLTLDLLPTDSARLSASPADGYRFIGWGELTEEGLNILSDQPEITFTVPMRETTVVAIFEQTFCLSVYSEEPSMGYFTADGEEEIELDLYARGEMTVELSAIPEEGYVFDGWFEIYEDGSESRYSNDASLTVQYGTSDRTFICRFTRQTEYIGTVYIVGEGQVIVNNQERKDGESLTIEAGSYMTCVVYPADGYRFAGWYERNDGQEDTLLVDADVTEVTFVVPYRDCVVVAVFEKITTVSVSVEDQAHGYLTVDGKSGTYNSYEIEGMGVAALITAHATDGYAFEGWYDGESLYSTEATIDVTVKVDHDLVAKYVPAYSLLIKSSSGGGFSVDGSALTVIHTAKLPAGVEFTFIPKADEGYSFKGLYTANADGRPDKLISDAAAGVSLYMPEGAYSLVAVFESDFKGHMTTVYVEDGEQGYVTVEGFTGTYTHFEDIRPSAHAYTVTATATPECRFEGWYKVEDGERTLLSSDPTYTFTQPNADVAVLALFVRTYPVKFVIVGPGTFVANGEVVDVVLNTRLSADDRMVLKAIAPAYAVFKGWYERVDGEPDRLLYDQPDVIFTVPQRATTVVAVFEESHIFKVSAEGYSDGCFAVGGEDDLRSSYSETYFGGHL